MKRLIFAAFAAAMFSAFAAPAPVKLDPPPPVCIVYDTSDTLVSYGAGGSTREQLLASFTSRINRYLVKYLNEKNIVVSNQPCNAGTDATLTMKLDSLSSIAERKRIFQTTTNARLKFYIKFASPQGAVFFDEDDNNDKEELDELAEKLATSIGKRLRPYY